MYLVAFAAIGTADKPRADPVIAAADHIGRLQIGRGGEDDISLVAKMAGIVVKDMKLPPAGAIPVFPGQRGVGLNLIVTPCCGLQRSRQKLEIQIAALGNRRGVPKSGEDPPVLRWVDDQILQSRIGAGRIQLAAAFQIVDDRRCDAGQPEQRPRFGIDPIVGCRQRRQITIVMWRAAGAGKVIAKGGLPGRSGGIDRLNGVNFAADLGQRALQVRSVGEIELQLLLWTYLRSIEPVRIRQRERPAFFCRVRSRRT